MADDYGTCPHDLFEDDRLAEASLADISGFALVVLACDDYGLFEGRSRVFARRFASTHIEVDALFARLEGLRLVRFYDAPSEQGPRRVGQVVDFHSYRGHPFRVANPSNRGRSLYPDETGEFIDPRRKRTSVQVDGDRKKGRAKHAMPESVQVKQDERASDVQAMCKPCASDLAHPRVDRAHSARASAQHSTAQQDPTLRSDPVSPPQGATQQEPSPAGSTDARARQEQQAPPASASSPPDASPAMRASGPALVGAGQALAEIIPEPEPVYAWEEFPDGTRGLMRVEPEPIVPVSPGARPCPQCGEPVDPGAGCWPCAERAADARARQDARAPPRLFVVGGEA